MFFHILTSFGISDEKITIKINYRTYNKHFPMNYEKHSTENNFIVSFNRFTILVLLNFPETVFEKYQKRKFPEKGFPEYIDPIFPTKMYEGSVFLNISYSNTCRNIHFLK